jgi:hypothetical protein
MEPPAPYRDGPPTCWGNVGDRVGEVKGVVESAVGQETGVAGDIRTVEFAQEPAVKLVSVRLGFAVNLKNNLILILLYTYNLS